MSNKLNTEIPNRLIWACRRGMLELDVLLGNFLKEAFLSASETDQNDFISLLSSEDQDLFMWLTGKKPPLDQFISIVQKVREHAKTRSKS